MTDHSNVLEGKTNGSQQQKERIKLVKENGLRIWQQ